mgnify:FL=1
MGNLDEIMSTPGLDAIYVGPNDLSLSLGYRPSPAPSEPAVLEAIETIAQAAERNGVVASIHCASGDMVKRMVARGYRFCTIANEIRLMAMKAAEEVAVAREND